MEGDMSLRKYQVYIILLTLFLLLANCGQERGNWKGTVRQEDGTTIISNPKEPMHPGEVLSLGKDITIGGAEATGEGAFNSLKSMDIDKDGNIFILSYNTKMRRYMYMIPRETS